MTERPELQPLYAAANEGAQATIAKVIMAGMTDLRLYPVDAVGPLREAGIGLIAAAFIASDQAPEQDWAAAEEVRAAILLKVGELRGVLS